MRSISTLAISPLRDGVQLRIRSSRLSIAGRALLILHLLLLVSLSLSILAH